MTRPDHYYQPSFEASFLLPRYWGTWILLGLMGLGALLPLRASHALGGVLGRLLWLTNAKRLGIARINIDLCFPDLSEQQREELLRKHYRASGEAVLDLGFIWWAPERRLKKHIRVTGLDDFLSLFAQGKRVIVLTGNFLNADLGGIYVSRFHPGIVMMKEIKNELFNWFVYRGRNRFLGKTTLRRQGLRPLIRAIREQRFCYYVPDEDFGADQSVFVPFMGVQTATLTALGGLARIANAVVVPCFARTLPHGQGFEVVLQEPLKEFPTGDEVTDARRMNDALEKGVRMMPEQYMWTFKWFKTQPENAPSPYNKTPDKQP